MRLHCNILSLKAGYSVFRFHCKDKAGRQATLTVHSVDWSLPGEVSFSCDDDALACVLLTRCRSDSGGHFNLLAGCKPLQVEQWLEYLHERREIETMDVQILHPAQADYAEQNGLQGESVQALLGLFYRIGGFNRLQITRYMKQRDNAALLSTKYSKDELERFRLLNEVLRLLSRLRASVRP